MKNMPITSMGKSPLTSLRNVYTAYKQCNILVHIYVILIYNYDVFLKLYRVFIKEILWVNSEVYIITISAFGVWWGRTCSRAGWSFWNLLINGAGGSIQIWLL